MISSLSWDSEDVFRPGFLNLSRCKKDHLEFVTHPWKTFECWGALRVPDNVVVWFYLFLLKHDSKVNNTLFHQQLSIKK